MSRIHGKDLASLNVDDSGGTPVDMLAETTSLDFAVSAATHDTTTFGDDWLEFTSGLKGGDEFQQELFYGNGSSEVWNKCTGRLGVAGTLSFGDGTRTVSMETIITKISLPIKVNDMVKQTVSHKMTGAVTFS